MNLDINSTLNNLGLDVTNYCDIEVVECQEYLRFDLILHNGVSYSVEVERDLGKEAIIYK